LRKTVSFPAPFLQNIGKKCLIGKTYLVGKICQIEEKLLIYKTFPAYKGLRPSISSLARLCRYVRDLISLVNRQIIYRAAVVSCLCVVVILNFTLPAGHASSAKKVKDQTPVEAGVGGGGYREKTLPEGIPEAEWNSELGGVLEPESFSKPRTLLYSAYTVNKGDMIGGLAESFGLNQDTLISINNIKNTRLLQIGQILRIPNQDGIMYMVKKGDTLETIAEKYKSNASDIQIANELFSDVALPGTSLFIPGAKLDWMERQEINGDLFMWPVSGYITSSYGYRVYPFDDDGGRQFHTGIDIGATTGTPVRAAMSGRVSSAGWDDVLGNHVVISHHAGYRTLYGHMSVIRVKTGAYVGTGERIGDVGTTGRSTGPHLHFTVYKNGVTVNPRSLLK
jgi:murein DD-endopeptidase MepM/ murein hydrolase activator NlpD